MEVPADNPCANCAALERQIAALEARLAQGNTTQRWLWRLLAAFQSSGAGRPNLVALGC